VARAKKPRKEIPPDLAAEVLVANDRTCCKCRTPNREVQIHHIDGNPANFARENLAVLCRDCHGLTETKFSFTRNFSPEEVRIYKASWEDQVRLRLNPHIEVDQQIELQLQVLLEITLIPHTWKIQYMNLYPGHFMDLGNRATGDIWDSMLKCGEHTYSETEWLKYRPLFTTGILEVTNVLRDLLSGYGEAVPSRVKLTVLRTTSVLKRCQNIYLMLPQICQVPEIGGSAFEPIFRDVIQALAELSRFADKERKAIAARSGRPISGGLAEPTDD
jgi:hypothetical protein